MSLIFSQSVDFSYFWEGKWILTVYNTQKSFASTQKCNVGNVKL